MKGIDEKRWKAAIYMASDRTGKSMEQLSLDAGFCNVYLYNSINKHSTPKPEMIRYICLKAKCRTDWVFGLTNIKEADKI